MSVVYYRLKLMCEYWREFIKLARLGFNPLRMLLLTVKQQYWRNVIASGNGDLYLSVEWRLK